MIVDCGDFQGLDMRGAEDHFTIGMLSNRLTLQYARDLGRSFTLHASAVNRFYLTFPEANATFTTNAQGQATGLVWTQSGATSTYARVRLPSSLALCRVNGVAELRLSGDTDRSYVIQASTDLERWSSISTNTIWDGPIADPESAGMARRYYRVLEP